MKAKTEKPTPKVDIDVRTGRVPEWAQVGHTVTVVSKDDGKYVICIDETEDDTLFFYNAETAGKYAKALADEKGYKVK
jgi:hypothetical protein